MLSPTVTELSRSLEPISRDTFIDGRRGPSLDGPRPLAQRSNVYELRRPAVRPLLRIAA